MRTASIVSVLAMMACQKDADIQSMGDGNAVYYQLYTGDRDTRESTTLSEIRNNPMTWKGRAVYGNVHVLETPTDRGFWIDSGNGDRLFALIVDTPRDAWKDIDPDQDLYLSQAWVRTPADLDGVPGEPLTEASRRLAESQPAYLVVDEASLVILSGDKMTKASSDGSGSWDWSAFDSDDDDRISRSEYDASFATWGYGRYDADGDDEIDDEEWREGLYEDWDANDDGYIDQAEYERSQEAWSHAVVDWPEYTTWDADGDGYVGSTEFADWDGSQTLYATYDVDGDDAIVIDEYASVTWDIWDADEDGYVTVSEYPYAAASRN